MRRVLFLAYHFPPVGGAGVQRSLRFARYLGDFGYEPVVVTGPGARGDKWNPSDASLEDVIPRELEVRRLSPEPPGCSPKPSRRERWLQRPTAFSRWWVEGAVTAGAEADVDLIYASMAPWETSAAAAELSRHLNRPWVADLRDPWALDEMFVSPTALHRLADIRTMRRALRSASGVVMNTREAQHVVEQRFPELDLVAAITNGFDESSFAGPDPVRRDHAFRIVHAGALHLDRGRDHRRARRRQQLLGGGINGVDIITRSHVFLLDALEHARAVDPQLAANVELHLAGVLSEEDRELIQGTTVRTHGFLPYPEAIALLRSADLLFLPMHDLAAGSRARIVPGKTYEYIASGRPILAAVPDGDARDMLTEVENAHLTRPADSVAMAAIVLDELRRKSRDGRAPTRRSAVAASFERRELTRRLASLFDEALDPEEKARDDDPAAPSVAPELSQARSSEL